MTILASSLIGCGKEAETEKQEIVSQTEETAPATETSEESKITDNEEKTEETENEAVNTSQEVDLTDVGTKAYDYISDVGEDPGKYLGKLITVKGHSFSYEDENGAVHHACAVDGENEGMGVGIDYCIESLEYPEDNTLITVEGTLDMVFIGNAGYVTLNDAKLNEG